MLHGVCLGTNDLVRSGAFYDRLLEPLGRLCETGISAPFYRHLAGVIEVPVDRRLSPHS